MCKSDFFLVHLSCFLSSKYYLYLTTAENKRVLKVKMLCLRYSTILFCTYVSFSGSKYVSRFTAGVSTSPLSPSHHCSQSPIVHVSNSLCQLESSSFERSSESSRKSRPARAAVSFLGTFTMILEGCRNWSS